MICVPEYQQHGYLLEFDCALSAFNCFKKYLKMWQYQPQRLNNEVYVLLRARTHPFDCPERNVIIECTSSHLVPHLTRVCISWWIAARRNIQRQIQQDSNEFVDPFSVDTDHGPGI